MSPLLAVVFILSLLAQGDTGQLSGTVVDANGAVVVSANVKLTSQSTSQVREVITGESGEFAFPLLPPGRYNVEVSANGFRTVLIDDANVNITQTTTLLVHLDAATVAGVVTINADPPLVQQESSQCGRVIEGDTIRQLPLPTRNFQQLLTLSPGTSASVSNNTELGRGDAIISVNGQRTTSNNVRINGIDVNALGTNATTNIAVPATDSLQEFIVQTSLYDASQGRNAGGNVEAVTRSGGNQFHGNAYYFIRNRALNANEFFLESAEQPKPVLSRQQFGGTFGGPIRRDRIFFFGSYQGTRETNGASLNNSLLFPFIPPQLRDENRSATALHTTFGVTPNPITVTILNRKLSSGAFAIPSASTASGLTPISAVSRFREDQFNANFDIRFSDTHTLSAKTIASLCAVPFWIMLLFSSNVPRLLLANYVLLGMSLIWIAPAMADVHELTGPYLRGLGIGVFLCLVHIVAYAIGSPLIGLLNDLLGAATNPGVMRYSFLISPISCILAAILLRRGSRALSE
jgi:hypothetical protein